METALDSLLLFLVAAGSLLVPLAVYNVYKLYKVCKEEKKGRT